MSDDGDERAQQRVGSTLNDKWTLERLVGVGGMAAVYAGVHRNGARAAVKVLHPSLARRPELRERFLREGYAANRVNHSGVVKVLDDDVIESGPDEGGAFLVMELLEGESVEDRIERGPPIEEKEVLAIASAVLDVLAAAHKAGVVHRDLKPENLFLAKDPANPNAPPRIKILDFGLARVAEAGNKTMAGMAIGTPSYMPPEQAAGRVQEIDARSDLFALGASCFRILAGRTVHPAESALAICARMAKEPAPKLESVAPNVSDKTAAAIDRALAFKREDRFRDAGAMRRAIDDASEALGGEVIQIESGMLEVVEPEAVAQKSSPRMEGAEPARKGSLGWLLGLIVLALLGVAVKIAWDRLHETTPVATAGDAMTSAAVDGLRDAERTHEEDATRAIAEVDATRNVVEPETDDAAEDALEAPNALDATVAFDASLDASVNAIPDAEIVDAHIALLDAGRRHHHDGGTHHVRHHHHSAR